MPVIIVIVVIAIAAAIWSMRRNVGGTGGHLPTGPPSGEAMQHMRNSAASGVTGSAAGGMSRPGGMPGGTGAPSGTPTGQ